MVRAASIALALAVLVGCGSREPEPSAPAPVPEEAADINDGLAAALASYQSRAQALVADMDAGVEPTALREALLALHALADGAYPAFARRHPACALYVAAAATLADRWQTLSVAEIERDYHHDGVLPAIADADQHALCYQMKDLLVHPLTALRMLEEVPVDLPALRHEIVEVVAHAGALRLLMDAQ